MPNTDLKRAGLKTTVPRLRILSILEERPDEHLSAEDVYRVLLDSGDEIGIATVYRVLTQFESAGLVKRHSFDSGPAVFELDSGDHHDHLVCSSCGKVVEFVDSTIEKRQNVIAERHDFELHDHSLVLYGLCGRCRKNGSRGR